jgi:DNA repair protein RecO (recombination protein O)
MKDFIKKSGAILLRSIDYRETSKIITAFTESYGKVQLIAKGVRNPKSRISAALQNLVHAEIVFYMRETQDLYLVKDATVVDFFENITGDLTRFAYASVIADFLYTLLATEQVSRTLFQYSLFMLKNINNVSKKKLPALLVRYLLKASSIIGFRMELNSCAACAKQHPTAVFFSHDTGGIICESCRHIDPQAFKLLPLLHRFLKASEQQEQDSRYPAMKPSEYKTLFLLLSNWLYFHTNRTLKTLNNHIQGKPFTVYEDSPGEQEEHPLPNTIPAFHKED